MACSQPLPNHPGVNIMCTTILVVDDDADLRNVLVRLLTWSGYTAECASGGAEALSRMQAAEEPPALVILDVNMPGIGGLDVLEYMRQEPRLMGVPVVCYSGTTVPEVQWEAALLGARAFLFKTRATCDELLATVACHVALPRVSA